MGIKNFFKKQLQTVIEWTDQDPDILFCKIVTPTDEIKNASKLIIAPGQACILVYEGKVRDVITEHGVYKLDSQNHPFITSLLKWLQAFESEHKLRLYFYRTAEILNQKWGTPTPVKFVDSIYHFPVEMGAYGNYSVRLAEAENMFVNLIGSSDQFTADDLRDIIVARLMSEMTSYLARAGYSYRTVDAHLSEMSVDLKEKLTFIFRDLGVDLCDFRIEATSFDDATRERINKIAGMTTEVHAAAEVGLDYVELEKLRALRDAARNEGGLAGAGLQAGAGFELSKTFISRKEELSGEKEGEDTVAQLKKLKLLLDEEILTQEEFNEKNKEILGRM